MDTISAESQRIIAKSQRIMEDIIMENVTVEFTKEEFDKIVEFMDGGEYETIQQAIIAAIENAE